MGKYKSIWTGPQIDEGVGAARNPDTTPNADSDALITSDAVAKVQQGFAPIETDATASQAYAIDDLLVWGGILYKAKTAIAVNDSFTVGTNIEATTIADKLNNIDTEITPDTDTTINGILVGDGSKVGVKTLDTSSLTDDNNHVPTSGVVKSALDAKADNSALGIEETGNTATHAITAGQYVMWKGAPYTADVNIAIGTTLASTGGSKNLTEVSNGGLNDLQSAFGDVEFLSNWYTPKGTGFNSSESYAKKCGRIYQIQICYTASSSGNIDIGTLSSEARPANALRYISYNNTNDTVGAAYNVRSSDGNVKLWGAESGKMYFMTFMFIK